MESIQRTQTQQSEIGSVKLPHGLKAYEHEIQLLQRLIRKHGGFINEEITT